jgi:uncharacterized membrane protein (TIGR02234 family)
MKKRAPTKSRAIAFGCLLAGGALALIASGQPWWRGVEDGASVNGAGLKFTGSQATGGLSQALAIVALAGTLLMLVLRSRGRRILGAVLLLVGIAVTLVGALWMQPRPDAVRSQLAHVGVLNTVGLTATAWPWLFALAGPLMATGAALVMITAAGWPAGSHRFQPDAQLTRSEEPAELWKAMDAGVDPTADDHDTLPAQDPEMRDRRARDTMDGTEQAAQQLPWSATSPKMGNSTGQVQRGRGDREA